MGFNAERAAAKKQGGRNSGGQGVRGFHVFVGCQGGPAVARSGPWSMKVKSGIALKLVCRTA